ncbi:helix-turn-helix domain-containing protein [Sphingosinicella sp. BN140058]|uniref:helix-turn-helix domain-containing protein n=1 Tax=Sphingosinicella sp. BN140058 TaxID=1892855 RepID=UPI0010116896|nr:helix-turn-helix transcriptional regulator [Sphingosinicella sp. BN140058]QAY77502.1 XRE family transcriptional regulator [Sphingosinicella sp. BN140058]
MEPNVRSREKIKPIGEQLRAWRQLRRLSQMDLALDAGISTRHLSFIETGRSKPSREMLALLAEQLDVPLRERNLLLLAGGFAPAYAERPLDHPDLAAARAAVERVLDAHDPFPALAVDRAWNLVAANRAAAGLIAGAAPELRVEPVNVLRLSLHPQGLAPAIRNLGEWKEHLIERVRRQAATSGDPRLLALLEELSGYDAPARTDGGFDDTAGLYVPLRLATLAGELDFFSTTTVFGTPLDVTLSELAIEAFFPANAQTAQRLRRLAASDA